MTDALSTKDFGAFYQEVHGYEPFPWQRKLMERVVEEGWPGAVDVPTGLGKTSLIDVSLFAAALGVPAARRRTFLVVDRRLVVDEAYEHAVAISKALSDTANAGPVTKRVAERLRQPGDDGPVLECTRMRGGVDWSWNWLERPDRHAVVVGTVDQVGSRLFFRGYGVGEHLRPIDAALVGTDSLIVVDEAHLSDPFLTSVRAACELESRTLPDGASADVRGRTPALVAMSASRQDDDAVVHGIDAEDEAHPFARKRLYAGKELRLLEVKTTKSTAPQKLASAMASAARQLSDELTREDRVVLVVCNTVARARAVHTELSCDGEDLDRDGSSAILLIGRNRPLAREYLLARWYGKIRAGEREPFTGTLYVVATQTVEVGANLDSDALVTECASLSALTQRLGRLNRLGERPASRCLVIQGTHTPEDVYGTARAATWGWLKSQQAPLLTRQPHKPLDLSGPGLDIAPAPLRLLLQELSPEEWSELNADPVTVPVLRRQDLTRWARTSPTPTPGQEANVAPFLHGIDHSRPQVNLVWRHDVALDAPQEAAAHLAALPPAASESVEVPLAAARLWLASLPHSDGDLAGAEDVSDLEAAPVPDEPEPRSTKPVAFRVHTGKEPEPVTATQIRPEDTLVVPATSGGCDAFGWHPTHRQPVIDLGDLTGGSLRRRATARVGPALGAAVAHCVPDEHELGCLWGVFAKECVKRLHSDGGLARDDLSTMLAPLGAALPAAGGNDGSPLPHLRVLRSLMGSPRLLPYEIPGTERPSADYLLTASPQAVGGDLESGGSTALGVTMNLAPHQEAVQRRADEFARNLGLPEQLRNSVRLAALLHDEGKRELRFQTMLHGGDHWAQMLSPEPRAKSGLDPTDHAAFVRAQQRSGYPHGMRHEALSGLVARARLEKQDYTHFEPLDPELVIHLVTSHHGRNRALLPPVTDPSPTHLDEHDRRLSSADTVDLEAPVRFQLLNQRYGHWGLARLESLVRLADIWASVRNEQHPAPEEAGS
ncbi:type I-U CRISPR-associated helicase/endonuclease Cas3 [Streptomyces sp. HNM0574]|uniref:type I-G CRISPR-associated helicase/endonuclease Cas3g n=1 Tax=Streptomyces sp. HNM0574 TaxID=2714954 RepID=UPI00146B6FC1|nr:type I-U CRISPR-associated helicase/endonuclease Cas3 [Streptomyces sp. HNM0574]NLU70862.1 type I-U CRISPR-associated helicase/endonuclease Cas3 [Streptomyces sp. HNM0574]